MKITSVSIENNKDIPSLYTCDGKDISPHLKWSEFPEETKSFALNCIDPDSPSGNFVHWAVVNIPAKTYEIKEGEINIPEALNLENDFGKTGYGGPCPGSGKHRYVFTIYALSTNLLSEINKDNMLQVINPYILDQTSITGYYQRK